MKKSFMFCSPSATIKKCDSVTEMRAHPDGLGTGWGRNKNGAAPKLKKKWPFNIYRNLIGKSRVMRS